MQPGLHPIAVALLLAAARLAAAGVTGSVAGCITGTCHQSGNEWQCVMTSSSSPKRRVACAEPPPSVQGQDQGGQTCVWWYDGPEGENADAECGNEAAEKLKAKVRQTTKDNKAARRRFAAKTRWHEGADVESAERDRAKKAQKQADNEAAALRLLTQHREQQGLPVGHEAGPSA